MERQNPRLSRNRLKCLQIKSLRAPDKLSKARREDTTLSQELWNYTINLRQRILQTYFVRGIGNGTLNPTAFGGYMVQDSVYCSRVKNSIDIAASRATDQELRNYLEEESKSYQSYAAGLFEKWHISDPDGIQLGDACLSYADYEESVAREKDTIYFIVAMIPCMKLWPWLGQQIKEGNHGVYTDWYNANFDPNYDGYKELDEFVDEAQSEGEIDSRRALEVFHRCMEGEFNFFNEVQKMY